MFATNLLNNHLLATLKTMLSFCILLLTAASAHAEAPVEGSLFDVVVLVPDESSAVQRGAFTKGLQQVLIRLSGDSQVLGKLKLPPATRYVKQYRYDKLDAPVDETGLLTRDQLQLWMQFDADKVQALLWQNGLPVWSPQRDRMVVWLAVRDGTQHYLLRRGDSSLIKNAVEQAARARGLPVVWPLYDAADQKMVPFADVWAGFQQPLLQASSRYANGAVLVGNLTWDGDKWVSEWSVLDAGKDMRRRYHNADYATVISQAFDQIADELGARYAVLEDDSAADARLARVEIKGVNSIDQYQQAEKLLSSLAAVKSTLLTELFDDYAVFRVAIRTSVEDFLQRIQRKPQLKQLAVPVASITPTEAAAQTGAVSTAVAKGAPPAMTRSLPVYRFQLTQAATL